MFGEFDAALPQQHFRIYDIHVFRQCVREQTGGKRGGYQLGVLARYFTAIS